MDDERGIGPECITKTVIEQTDEHPAVELRFAEVDGRIACVSVEIGARLIRNPPEVPGPGRFQLWPGERLERLTTARLRTVNLARLVDAFLLDYLRGLEEITDHLRAGKPMAVFGGTEESLKGMPERLEQHRQVTAAAAAQPKRPGRPRVYDDAYYETVSRVYNSHGGRSPLKAVQAHFKQLGRPLTDAMVRHHVHEARRRGLIPPWEERPVKES